MSHINESRHKSTSHVTYQRVNVANGIRNIKKLPVKIGGVFSCGRFARGHQKDFVELFDVVVHFNNSVIGRHGNVLCACVCVCVCFACSRRRRVFEPTPIHTHKRLTRLGNPLDRRTCRSSARERKQRPTPATRGHSRQFILEVRCRSPRDTQFCILYNHS